MEKGISNYTRMITKYMGEDSKEEIERLLEEIKSTKIVEKDFSEDLREFEKESTLEDFMTIRSYTGYDFRFINAVLRDNWNYEEHGKQEKEMVERYQKTAEEIRNLISRFPSPKETFMTYRGTTLSEFKKYGIHSLEELITLKGNYLYELGFTSTSLKEDTSYFGKEVNGIIPNIEVKYIIPASSQDGMPLTTDNLSYSKGQNEYLLNSGALSKVVDVQIFNQTATILVVLIPQKVWNKEVKQDLGEDYGLKKQKI